jgi:hypothetical protein
MAFIALSKPKNGAVYATVAESVRQGKKVAQRRLENLGRVIDLEQGIFKSRERGVFRYSLSEGFSGADDYLARHQAPDIRKERLILDFGDSYVLERYLAGLSFCDAIKNALPDEADTLLSLLFYRILTDKKAYCHALSWWEGSYASVLFPTAHMAGQRVSEFLLRLGDEGTWRGFFADYLDAVYGQGKGDGAILIDSTGLPNASGMALTQINNHNGDISLEARLIYVVDRRNGMPIYFRYCPGNIVDVSTLCTTVTELVHYGIPVKHAIIDAGYFSEGNARELYRNGVHFVTRLAPNRKMYKDVLEAELPGLLTAEHAVRYGGRLLYIRKARIDVYGNEGYAYVGVDVDSRNAQMKRTAFASMDDGICAKEADARMSRLGVFVILASDDMGTTDILPLYYTRQQVEQIFDIGKNNADILPLRIQGEGTFRGHLMLTFMATAILQRLQRDILSKRKKPDKTNPEGAFIRLRNQKCKVFDRAIIPQEPVKAINDIYRLLEIECPTSIARDGST